MRILLSIDGLIEAFHSHHSLQLTLTSQLATRACLIDTMKGSRRSPPIDPDATLSKFRPVNVKIWYGERKWKFTQRESPSPHSHLRICPFSMTVLHDLAKLFEQLFRFQRLSFSIHHDFIEIPLMGHDDVLATSREE